MGKQWKQWQTLFCGGSKITADGNFSHEIKRCLLLGRKAMTNLDSVLKNRDITDKGPYSQSYDFSSNHVWVWDLDHKEGWMLMNWCFWTVMLEKTLESDLDSKEMKLLNPKGNQSWIFIRWTDAEPETPILWPPNAKNLTHIKTRMMGKIEGRRRRGWQRMRWLDGKEVQSVYPKGNQSWIFIGKTDTEAEAPILWPHDGKNWLIGKDPDAGKDWRQEEKGMTGWDVWMISPILWTWIWAIPGVGNGQGGLVFCSPWGYK